MYTIDKSRFTAEELETYEALIAKAAVDPEANKEEAEEEIPPVATPKKKPVEKEVDDPVETKKSAEPEIPQFVKDAIAKSAEFIEKSERKDMAEIAKKYAALVENVDDLANQLYDLKKSNTSMYDTCIAMMDKQAALIEKSPLFSEIGKSAGGYSAAGGAVSKAEAKAREIQKSDSSISWDAAIAKAWEDPQLMAEYDAEYNGR